MKKVSHTHVLVIGGGIAGMYAAIQFPNEVKVTVLSKSKLTLCNSSLAQGGIASVLDTVNDSTDRHFEDTLIAGNFENNEQAVRVLVEEGPDDVLKMLELGCDFDKNPDGTLQMTLEGGHTRRRIAHHRDSTGEEMTNTLIREVERRDNITVIENTFVYDIEQVTGGFLAYAANEEGGVSQLSYFAADYVILATGGVGRVYKYTTNSAIATGDGISLAESLGAETKNISYIQFHPTAFAAKGRERFLISEAVRGEGAYLLNCNRERFMHQYDDRLELAPRDVVSKSIILESRRTGSEQFFLDITHKDAAFLKDRFPMIYTRCKLEGVDITCDLIPIFPCQHYIMGGIDVDLFSRTRIPGLYAAGECSHTGVHGKNRLASNSLLEALVFGRRAAEHILALSEFERVRPPEPFSHFASAPMPSGFRTSIREIMQSSFFVLPDADAAARNLDGLKQISRRLGTNKFEISRAYTEAKSLAVVAKAILSEVAAR